MFKKNRSMVALAILVVVSMLASGCFGPFKKQYTLTINFVPAAAGEKIEWKADKEAAYEFELKDLKAKEGYEFVEFKDAGDFADLVYDEEEGKWSIIMDGNKTLTAVFEGVPELSDVEKKLAEILEEFGKLDPPAAEEKERVAFFVQYAGIIRELDELINELTDEDPDLELEGLDVFDEIVGELDELVEEAIDNAETAISNLDSMDVSFDNLDGVGDKIEEVKEIVQAAKDLDPEAKITVPGDKSLEKFLDGVEEKMYEAIVAKRPAVEQAIVALGDIDGIDAGKAEDIASARDDVAKIRDYAPDLEIRGEGKLEAIVAKVAGLLKGAAEEKIKDIPKTPKTKDDEGFEAFEEAVNEARVAVDAALEFDDTLVIKDLAKLVDAEAALYRLTKE